MSAHIVYLNPVGAVGGAERILLAAVRQTHNLRPGWRLSAILFGDGPLRPLLEEAGACVTVVKLPGTLAALGDTQLRGGASRTVKSLAMLKSMVRGAPAALAFLRMLRATLRALRPDVIHSNGLKTHLLAALTRPRSTPVLWHLHDFYSHRPLIARHIRRFTRGVAGAIAISDAVRRDCEAILAPVPITTIRNPVDTAHFSPGEASALPSEAGTTRIGLVATYANWKGQDVFLKAAARVKGPARFSIVGGPIYATAGSQFSLAELETMAAALNLGDRVRFVPFLPDPRDIYRSLDIVVHASTRAEPFGLTIAEAMSCGRAVIVAAAGGAKELFTEGVDAIGHEPGNVESLAAAMERLMDDPDLRQRVGSAARHTALDRFAEEPFGRKLIATYESTLAAVTANSKRCRDRHR